MDNLDCTAVYLRVSTNDQTTDSQVADINAWSAANNCKPIPFDDAFTGTKMKRPGFDNLMVLVRAKKIRRIVVWRLDRLGRTASGLTSLFDELVELGCDLVSLRDGFDLNTPSGRLHARILASVAEFETEIRRERQAAGIKVCKAVQLEAHRLFKEGVGVTVIAERINRPLAIVEKMLKAKPGTVWWAVGRKPNESEPRRQQILDLYMRGMKSSEVKAIVGIKHRCLCKHVKILGGMKHIKALVAAHRAKKTCSDATHAMVQ